MSRRRALRARNRNLGRRSQRPVSYVLLEWDLPPDLLGLIPASLRDPEPADRKAAQEKQETPEVGPSEVSTAHPVANTEVRAASAQSDTGTRR